ncbi:universal stress protein [Burkholderia multivorans]|uniref:Universal stress protein n=1 Tax=Burkholderia dolosa TaxID=152500 RepID=A0A892IK88_9BURK|nr:MULTISPECIES: universal stress protein [Burkholderia]AKE01935.1 universal stress protein UspA [Burkholderia cepacia]AJY11622.1 universal stress family protein [Burkholderia dolosa AU0158]AYZ95640.1 universal stress protein [Burkholderia dolosa]EAY71986.1 Universal stress protein UspA [Burkholderia dolosa AU0158]ETP61726.1 universal stress protein A [Burkholderia dolosa PC543]
MSYKSLVVHLDTSTGAHARLEFALRVARRFGAHLTGLFAIYTPEPHSFYVMAGSADYFRDQRERRDERRAALERLFHAETARAKVPSAWLRTDGRANVAVPRAARLADLVIAGQSDPNDPETYIDDQFAENLVLSAGRPVLFVPYAGTFASVGERVAVGWDGSREATRAAHDALPFLERAKRTTVIAVTNGDSEAAATRVPAADAALMLARHAPDVHVLDIGAGAGASVGDTLLSRAYESGSDLLVMGAYGHSRWHELLMGGATRTVLASMTLPVLMSH